MRGHTYLLCLDVVILRWLLWQGVLPQVSGWKERSYQKHHSNSLVNNRYCIGQQKQKTAECTASSPREQRSTWPYFPSCAMILIRNNKERWNINSWPIHSSVNFLYDWFGFEKLKESLPADDSRADCVDICLSIGLVSLSFPRDLNSRLL